MKIRINGKVKEILECPYCASDEIYQLFTLKGKGFYLTKLDPENKEQCDNTNMYDGFSDLTQKTVYCSNCQKKLGYIVED